MDKRIELILSLILFGRVKFIFKVELFVARADELFYLSSLKYKSNILTSL